MPLDNETWADANGGWVVYIGYNCEWELLNVYTRHRVPLPKISDCPEVEHTGILRTFNYDHGDCRLQKIAICQVPDCPWHLMDYGVVAIFDKLVAFLHGSTGWILLKNQFLYTDDEYYDAIEYEDLVFASTTRGMFLHGILIVSVRLSSTVIIIVSSTCMWVSKFPFTN